MTVDDTANAIIVVGGVEVDINIGSPAKGTLDCSENSIKSVKIEQKGTTLSISTAPTFYAKTAKITLTMPQVTAITAGGTALVKVTGIQDAPMLTVAGSGSSTVEVFGTVHNLVASTSDQSYLKLKGLSAKTVSATSSDKSVAHVRASDNATASTSGTSVISVFGLPTAAVTKASKDKSLVTVAPR